MEKRRLGELRVVDLRVELEKRSLDKNGVKAALVERLAQALTNEGHEPESYIFDTVETTTPKREKVVTPKRQRRVKEGDGEQEGEDEEDFEAESGDSVQHDVGDLLVDNSMIVEKNVPAVEFEQPTTTSTSPSTELSNDGIFKVPNPDTVEPQCPFTVEDTIRLHNNRPIGGDDTSSLFVNTDDGGGSEADQNENEKDEDGDRVPSIKTELNDESIDTSLAMMNDEANETPTNELIPTPFMEKQEIMNPIGEDTSMKADTGDQNITIGDETKAEIGEQQIATADDSQRDDDSKLEPAKIEQAESKTEGQVAGDKTDSKLTKGKDLWISGISTNTRATEIKTLFLKYGRVCVARIVQSTKPAGSKCYAFVSMSTADEASKCIQNLHRTELHGRTITVERAKSDQANVNVKKPAPATGAAAGTQQTKKPAIMVPKSDSNGGGGTTGEDQAAVGAVPTDSAKPAGDSKEAEKGTEEGDKKAIERKPLKTQSSKEKVSKDTKPKDTKHRSRSRSRHRSGSRDRRPAMARGGGHRPFRPPIQQHRTMRPPPSRGPPPHLRGGFERNLARAALARARGGDLRRDRERERERERERQREIEDRLRQKEMEFRQREEKLQIEKEKERLKYERERLERERLELANLRMQTATYVRERIPPATTPMNSMKRPYDSPSMYSPDTKRGNYGVSSSGGYPSRGSGRDRTPPRRDSYGTRDMSRSDNRYTGDSSRSSDRRPPATTSSSSIRRGSQQDDYRQRRSEPGRSAPSHRHAPSPPRRSRDAPPPPPPPPRGHSTAWSSSSGGRHSTSGGMRDRDGGYSSSSRMNVGSSTNYGSRSTFPQQSTGGHTTAPWAAAPGLAGMASVGSWGRPGNAPAPVGPNVWASMPTNVFPNAMGGASSGGNYGGGDRFDSYGGKSYSSSTGRRY